MRNRIARNLAQCKPRTLFVGVDIGKRHNAVCIVGWDARVLTNFTMENSREGFNLLIRRVREWKERMRAEAILFGCEPAGHYWRPLAYFLKSERLPFRLVSPFTVRRYREGIDLARNKNDRRDAAMIAELLHTGKSLEPRLPQGVYADLKHTYRSYRRVRTERTRHGNLLTGMMDLLFPEYHGVFKDLTRKSSVAALCFCPAPSRIQMMSLDEWMLGVRHCFEGQRLMVAKLREIYKLAQDSIGIPEEEESLVSDVEYLLALLTVLDNRITILERKLLELLRDINGYEHLLSIPGIASLTAAGILAEVGNIQDFHKSKEVVKFSGVQPTEEQSSQYRGKSSMTKKGSPGLRSALYLAVLNLVRCNPVFKDHYDHLVHRDKRPLSKMKALGAMMNKLLRIVYALMSKGEDFDPQKASPQQGKEVALVAV